MFKFKYAHVENGKVIAHQSAQKAIDAPHLVLVAELPILNSTYDAGSKVFTVPVIEVKAVREITLAAFRARFTFTEKIGIESSTDAGIRVLEKDLAARLTIRLDLLQLQDGLDYYISKNLLTASRKAELLANGTQDEQT